jgi:TorA maturation chaperone TorD
MTPSRYDAGELCEIRREVYRFLWSALDRPSCEQHAWMCSEAFRTTLAVLLEAFGLPCPQGELIPAEAADHEARYIACFEVGLPGPPVPLLASHYNKREPAPGTIHEHILFYKQFRVRPPAEGEPADHLVNELAFLIHLDNLVGKAPPDSIFLARRDFLSRHITRWPATALRAAEEAHLPAVYLALLALLDAAVRQDLELTDEALANRAEATSCTHNP